MTTLVCTACGTKFTAKNKTRKYCSSYCYWSINRRGAAHRVLTGLKTCARCHVVKDISRFSPASARVIDKVHGWCKACRAANENSRRKSRRIIDAQHDRYETDMEFRARELLRAVGKKCRRLGLVMDLDQEWLAVKLRAGVCELSGVTFNMDVRSRKANVRTPSIDRIKAGSGYTKDNCRVVAFGVNSALQAWGLEAFMELAEGLVARHSKKAAVCAA